MSCYKTNMWLSRQTRLLSRQKYACCDLSWQKWYLWQAYLCRDSCFDVNYALTSWTISWGKDKNGVAYLPVFSFINGPATLANAKKAHNICFGIGWPLFKRCGNHVELMCDDAWACGTNELVDALRSWPISMESSFPYENYKYKSKFLNKRISNLRVLS